VTLRDRAAAVGIDPDDPRYDNAGEFGMGDEWCPWCLRHGTTRPRLRCDVQQAEYALMDAETTAKCYRCHEPFTGKQFTLCGECEAQDAMAAKKERQRTPMRTGFHRPDGHGCVERVHPVEAAVEARAMGRLPEDWA
jgi:hypothetical protein